MTIKPHFVQIRSKPTGFSDMRPLTLPVSGYRHKVLARGGDDTMSCTLSLPVTDIERFFEQYLGNEVLAYVDNPCEPIWDGFINRITLRAGGLVFTRSLDNMINRVNTAFYNADSASTAKTEQTAVINNTTSQAIYGVKEGTIDAGVHYNNADKTHKTTLRNTLLGIRAYPEISASSGGSSALAQIEVECLGWVHFVYGWQNYLDATNVTTSAGALFNRVTRGAVRPSNFSLVVSTFQGFLTANTSFNMSQNSRTGQTYRQFIDSIVEAGDGVQQWVWGLTRPNFNTIARFVYYRPASTAIKYVTYAYRDVGFLRNPQGVVINSWEVLPDAGVQIADAFVGWSLAGAGAGDDPRVGYIQAIEYDAEAGAVTWQTGDNITLEGALQFDRYFKTQGSRFGATIRPLV